jgi:quinol monooxygenase YgiN
MAEHATVVRVLRMKPGPGKRTELISRLEAGAEQIRQLEGCFGVQICAIREAPEEVASISRWASQAALDAFLRGSEPQRSDLYELAAGPAAIEHFISIHESVASS